MSNQIIVMPAPIVFNMGPYGYWKYAKDFLVVARLAPTDPFSPVPYFLYCQSIELALKAFLLHQRITKEELKERVGHDLVSLFKKAIDCGLTALQRIDVRKDAKLLAIANTPYSTGKKGKRFQYFDVVWFLGRGRKTLPDLKALDDLATRLIDDPAVEERYLNG